MKLQEFLSTALTFLHRLDAPVDPKRVTFDWVKTKRYTNDLLASKASRFPPQILLIDAVAAFLAPDDSRRFAVALDRNLPITLVLAMSEDPTPAEETRAREIWEAVTRAKTFEDVVIIFARCHPRRVGALLDAISSVEMDMDAVEEDFERFIESLSESSSDEEPSESYTNTGRRPRQRGYGQFRTLPSSEHSTSTYMCILRDVLGTAREISRRRTGTPESVFLKLLEDVHKLMRGPYSEKSGNPNVIAHALNAIYEVVELSSHLFYFNSRRHYAGIAHRWVKKVIVDDDKAYLFTEIPLTVPSPFPRLSDFVEKENVDMEEVLRRSLPHAFTGWPTGTTRTYTMHPEIRIARYFYLHYRQFRYLDKILFESTLR